MAECIDRQKAIEQIKAEWAKLPLAETTGFGILMRVLTSIPAADVRPVVLCRDCKRYGGRPWENNESGICARTDCGVGKDDFCSYGEKLEES